MNIATFKAVLGIITIATVLAWAAIGYAMGQLVDGFSGGRGSGAVIGLLIGGGLGYVIGAYVHGIAYTLLSINDHLAAIRKTTSPEAAKPTEEVFA